MTISVKMKAVFSCKCIHCGYEWEAIKKPDRCARRGCKKKSWNGEDHRFANPYNGRGATKTLVALPGVPVSSQIEDGTKAPRPPSYESMMGSLIAARIIIEDLIVANPCNHKKGECVCAEKDTLAVIDQHIEKLGKLRPLRSTYLARKSKTKTATAV